MAASTKWMVTVIVAVVLICGTVLVAVRWLTAEDDPCSSGTQRQRIACKYGDG